MHCSAGRTERELLNVEQAIAIYKQIQTEYPPEKNRRIWLANELRLSLRLYLSGGWLVRQQYGQDDRARRSGSEQGVHRGSAARMAQRKTCSNLLLMNLAVGNLSENLDRAIAVFNEILSNSSAQTNPRISSGTHSFLGDAYLKRTQGSRAENPSRRAGSLATASTQYRQRGVGTDQRPGRSRRQARRCPVGAKQTGGGERSLGTGTQRLSAHAGDRHRSSRCQRPGNVRRVAVCGIGLSWWFRKATWKKRSRSSAKVGRGRWLSP